MADLRAGRESVAALLVSIAGERLRAAGVDVPHAAVARPSHALYDLLAREHEADAHGRYNALIRRLVSYARAAEHARTR